MAKAVNICDHHCRNRVTRVVRVADYLIDITYVTYACARCGAEWKAGYGYNPGDVAPVVGDAIDLAPKAGD